jgi:FkbM family methyltransferase
MSVPLTYLFAKVYDNRYTRPAQRSIIRWFAARKVPRYLLNWYYRAISFERKSRFHSRYSKIFGPEHSIVPGQWTIDFLGRRIRLPLRSSLCWLDWDYGVSVLGHDAEIKQTYAELIQSDHCPAVFLDVGSNYGTHAVLFLAMGIPIIAFEPIAACFRHFQMVCELNDLSGRWESVALGKAAGKIKLVYPEKECWLGATSDKVISNLRSHFATLEEIEVPLRRLDDYLDEMPEGEILLKLDVEGFEMDVLHGSSRLLRDRSPNVIFESNDMEMRPTIFDLLREFGYNVHPLPWRALGKSRVLSKHEFVLDSANNFIAVRDSG